MESKIKLFPTDIFFLILSIFSFTYLRKYLVIFVPVFLIASFFFLKLRINSNSIIVLLLVALISIVTSFFHGIYILNNLISIALVMSPLLILFGRAGMKPHSLSERFILISSSVLLFVDFTAVLDLLIHVFDVGFIASDDTFQGIYGNSGLSMHTLSLVNYLYALLFYFRKSYLQASAFLISGLLCFFGAGLMTFLLTILIFILLLRNGIKFYFSVLVSIASIVLILKVINPSSYNYFLYNVTEFVINLNSTNYEDELNLAKSGKASIAPRKLTFHLGVLKRLQENPEIILIGTGPGTYNSRTSFLLNGDYSKIEYLKETIRIRPPMADEDVYPLWDTSILFQYNDGTRNEPFSSIVSVMMEYGVPIAFIIFLLSIKKVTTLARNNHVNGMFIKLSFIFFLLCLLGDNYIEYPEVTLIYFVLLKTFEIDLQHN